MAQQLRQLLHQKLQHHYGHTSFRSLQLDACEAILHGHDTLLILPTGGLHALTAGSMSTPSTAFFSLLHHDSTKAALEGPQHLRSGFAGGKSLAFQLPVLLKDPGVTVVICPVRMQLQKMHDNFSTAARKANISCAAQLIALAKDQVEKCDESSIEAELWNSSVPAAKLELLARELCSEEPTLKLLYTTPGDHRLQDSDLRFCRFADPCATMHSLLDRQNLF